MLRTLLSIAALVTCSLAYACDPMTPLNTFDARETPNVFVFRIVSIRAGDEAGRTAEGEIRVMANVRGRTTATRLKYWISSCGGISMDPGVDYIGFLPSDTQILVATPETVVPLPGGRFDRRVADELEAVLRGKKDLDEVFALTWDVNRRDIPPPPCRRPRTPP